ncbi:MAG: hypothetical protein ACYDBS_03395 [Acidimicrobiales bacterium]
MATIAGAAMSWRFLLPVRLGDTIRTAGRVEESREPRSGRAAIT